MFEGISHFVLNSIESLGYWGILILMAAESVNIPLPSEIIMPFAGFLASQAKIDLPAVILFGALGNLLGSLLNYFIGFRYGARAVTILSKIHLVHEDEIEIARGLFHRFGIITIFLSRMMPVVRPFISFPAGMFRVGVVKFSVLTFLGSLIWSSLLAYLGFVLGQNWTILGPYFKEFDYVTIILILGFILWRLRHHLYKVKLVRREKINHSQLEK